MTITADVQRQFFGTATTAASNEAANTRTPVIRLPPVASTPSTAAHAMLSQQKGAPWTQQEHERFLAGLEMYPRGPWKLVAQVVGTRSTRQTMTHAQKYRQRIARHVKLNGAMAGTPTASPVPVRKAASDVPATKDGTRRSGEEEMHEQPASAESTAETELHPELKAIEWLLSVLPLYDDSEWEDCAAAASEDVCRVNRCG